MYGISQKRLKKKYQHRYFLSLRHPNHFVLAGANNSKVIITYRFLVPIQANRNFFWHTDCIISFNCKYFP